VVLLFSVPTFIYAQVRNETSGNKKDLTSIESTNDTIPENDSTIYKPKPKNIIETKVIYSATDSIVLSRDSKKVYLYKDAKVEYGEIILKADYIEYNQEENFVYATGILDSLGNLIGKPEFKENTEEFKARTIKYNFKTKKGYIEDVFTEEEQGFLHSQQTKKLEDNSFLLKNGKYTTCENEDHPHFYLSMTQAKVIPNDKIVSGPAYIVVHDIPIKFLGVPFGFFPNQKEYSSGIIIPKYGEEKVRGFFLQNGGYYFGISDKMDLAITGNIFSKGSWGSDVKFRYKKRYKFTSDFNFTYAEFIKSEVGLPDYKKSKDMSIRWTHSQDPKANPNTKFTASVNYSTSTYDQFNSQTLDQRATNTKSSSISYGKSWPGRPYRFNMDLRHSQNSNTNNITLTLPVLTFNVDRQYPFRKKNASGEMKWYENIELQYSSKAENRISTADTLLFNNTKFSDFQNGFQHQIPISTNFKILKYFNLSPRVEYTGILYPSIMEYGYEQSTNANGDTIYVLTQDTVSALKYAQIIKPSISLSVGPNIYGFYNFKNPEAKIQRIRHVVTPSISVSYVPDLGSMVNQYYFTDTTTNREYSIFKNGIYNFPSAPGESGSVSFGLNNNLEMKVRNDEDTTGTGTKKIKLLESFKISTSYNIFADSLNWSQFSINGRTSMFENKLIINFSAIVDPYAINENGQVYNEFYYNTKPGEFFLNRLGRLERFDISLSTKLNSKKGDQESGHGGRGEMGEPTPQQLEGLRHGYNYETANPVFTYVDFEIPWNISIDYKFIYSKTGLESSKKITQTLGVTGDISLTKKWKISIRANYDIAEDELSNASINIHRDLHCWEMSFSWIPVGYMQSYNFQINVKGSTLRDFLKYNKRKSWQDNL